MIALAIRCCAFLALATGALGTDCAAAADLAQRVGADRIVFVKRFTYTPNHYYTEFINSHWTPGGSSSPGRPGRKRVTGSTRSTWTARACGS